MRTVKELESLARNEVKIRISRIPNEEGFIVTPWPQNPILYVDVAWLDEKKSSEIQLANMMDCAIAMRQDWIFNAVWMLAESGFALLVVSLVWNFVLSPVLGLFGFHFTTTSSVIWDGLAMFIAGVALRLKFQLFFRRRGHARAMHMLLKREIETAMSIEKTKVNKDSDREQS